MSANDFITRRPSYRQSPVVQSYEQNEEGIGLGDVVEKITEVTGIKKIVEKVTGKKGCGCGARKKSLNRIRMTTKERRQRKYK